MRPSTLMHPPSHYRYVLAVLLMTGLLAACSKGNGLLPGLFKTKTATPTTTSTITAPIPPSATPEPTATVTPRPSATMDATPTWMVHPAKQVVAPILLYHHIAAKDDRYYVSPEVFEQQMKTLVDLGYTSISISQLVDVLLHGGELPERPVVITFDDGDVDVYQNAYPVMETLGLTGTFYIVATRLNADEFITVSQLKEMIDSGWDIGCHSMTHIDLTQNHDAMTYEAGKCKNDLQKDLGVMITTFAYPFGSMDPFVADKVAKYGYLAAVGLGTSYEHDWGTLYYLSRLEVQNDYDLAAFVSLLPWKQPLP